MGVLNEKMCKWEKIDINININISQESQEMKEMKEFITIWDNYYCVLPINDYEYDKYVKIIIKLRKESELELKEIKIFIELIEILTDTITNYADESNDGTQQTKIYEQELNCCSRLILLLEEIIRRPIASLTLESK